MKLGICVFLIPALLGVSALIVHADEGMWLFTNPPRKLLEEKYHFNATDKWLEHVQKSSVRFNSGGSGSFVSAEGLVLTNHHVGADALQKFGDKEHNYLRDGFYAKTRAEEKKCLDLELNVLMSMEVVTERVNAAVTPDMKPKQAADARKKIMAQIEQESLEKTKLRSDVVTLYNGGQYHLYRYKKYTDIRLVFAPEQQIAFFGGDPDNFEYPRYDLDICVFRVYENDQPAKLEHYLTWSKSGVKENELVFVSGHPGRTDRMATMAELHYLRDKVFPFTLERLYRQEVLLIAYSARSDENARQAKELLFSVQNSRKARDGGLAGLLDPAIMGKKQAAEEALRTGVASRTDLRDTGAAWDRIAGAVKVQSDNLVKFTMLEGARGGASGFLSTYFAIARTLVRAAEERPKPSGDRLREFRESNRESLEQQLFSEEPIYDTLEQTRLTSSLTYLAEKLGDEDKLVQSVLAGKSPSERAHELISGTKLRSVEERKRLYEAGKKAIDESTDPMIRLALLVDPEARSLRKVAEEQDEILRQAYAQIAHAKYVLEGSNSYPDATFTLRLAFGEVKGYEEDGKPVPFETTFAGLYERSAEHHDKEPFNLPKRWVERKDKLDLSTPFNFVCTADIIGGNSGSPVINRNAEFVGIIFDGNIQSLVLDFVYDDRIARAVSVCSQSIIEALRKVYDAGPLADELTGSR
ncbi:MAG TPA: S46 family peptidase [Gemmataceae bacterium]|nr:S46 family peptidase [Gemmataceae bacterium]